MAAGINEPVRTEPGGEPAGRWQATFDAVAAGILWLDERDVVWHCNRAATAMLGRPPTELLRRQLDELLAPAADALRRRRGLTSSRSRGTDNRRTNTARGAGFDLHLTKPVDIAALEAILASVKAGPA
jgi:PAS domain-containing protein